MSEAPPPAGLTYFEPRPALSELPARLASPFDPSPPHPLARRAAEALQARLLRGDLTGFDVGVLDAPGGGKMFGVLVVAAGDGRLGYLCAFSGMLGGSWHVEGFAPPLFDPVSRDTFWPEGQAELRELELRRADPREPDAGRAEVEHLRAERSRQLWRRLTDSYVLPNARGERQSLTALFEPEAPPGGAGDCAAPKLFAWAYQHRLRPVALAEFWWGALPVKGERLTGGYYPACQGKCGKVLPYMLEGLAVDPAPPGSTGPMPLEEPRLVFEDAWLLVVDKPAGLPSAPGRHAPQRDSVLVRFQQRAPEASKLAVVHALDTEASGILLLAKDAETLAALRRQLARREADLRHVAWLDGAVTGDHGVIELLLRSDVDEQLRHLVDPAHGKRAVTEWRVTQRADARTRVTLLPRTRLTHQLRAHVAHPLGLDAPIIGDTLYGRDDTRLMLHAEALAFAHPRTGERLEFESRPPF
ncbi:RluA family pseudouridine synthase [Pyxidicoccus trucidator]|uniref:RluA family pseudouridine synthase n=1 Tax=Pyxidicoccus trucidator TaxID=2709662 RepID=UPI001F0826EB|nr:RluA family pseudouridine synthase [Pyxidicoccus trucidator]